MCMLDDVAQFYYRKLTPEEAETYGKYLEGQRQQRLDNQKAKEAEKDE